MNIRETRATKPLVHAVIGLYLGRHWVRCGRLLSVKEHTLSEEDAIETDEPATCLQCAASGSAP